MYKGIKHLHSYLPYLILALLIMSVAVFLSKWAQKKSFTKGDKSMAFVTLILAHLQFAIGLALYFISPITKAAFNSGEMMSNSTYRFYAIEHIAIMILAIALVTIGYSRAKRHTDPVKKFRTLSVFYLSGLILALLRIPWDVWPY